ncbi:MAG: glucose-1-phosphate adenylyltransferase subunit GlgD [Clostridia bacterium]|nr:glucose-1-phosphate adenylyltransferase subunit GlgD [Clostridia bacterium]
MANASGIIFSSLNKNTLSRLTANRTVAAIPFACRYRLIDFCLSNLVNSGIYDISIVANYNYRSLYEHIGSGKDWDLARRSGGVNLISPYQTINDPSSAKMFSTRLEALRSISEFLREMKNDHVVLMDSDTVLNVDLGAIIDEHKASGAVITVVTKETDESFSSKNPRMMIKTSDGYISDIAMSDKFDSDHRELSLGIFILDKLTLLRIVEDATAHNNVSLTEFLMRSCKSNRYATYKYNGYCAVISSFLDYYKYSIELATSRAAREALFEIKDRPILTKVHNSSPKLFKGEANIVRSILADESSIEGSVINSVIFRGVKIGRGSVVRNSVLFHGTYVGESCSLDSIVTDKNVFIGDRTKLSGCHSLPFYIEKGRRV